MLNREAVLPSPCNVVKETSDGATASRLSFVPSFRGFARRTRVTHGYSWVTLWVEEMMEQM
jgi:hypothetical protein